MKQMELGQDQFFMKRGVTILVSAVLWVVSVILALLAIFAVREVVIWALATALTGDDQASRLQAAHFVNLGQDCAIVALGLIGLIAIIYSGDYFFHHMGEARLLRRLLVIIAVECVIVVPVALIFW